MTTIRHTVPCMLAILIGCLVALGNQTGNHSSPAKQKSLPTLSAQEIFKRVSPSVMVVESLDAEGKVTKLGSGVVIGRLKPCEKKWSVPPTPGKVYKVLGCAVVTNRHVIEDGVSFRVEHGGKKWPAKLIRVDPDHDLAELSVAGLEAPAVTVLDSSKLAVGETVYAIGSPEGLELTISEGLISGLRDFDKGRIIQTSAAISPGSSGGGLFDAQGRLVGITTFYLKEGQSLNFALPAEWTFALDRQPASARTTGGQNSTTFQELLWLEVALKFAETGELEASAHALEQLLRVRPDMEQAWVILGTNYLVIGRFDVALGAYQRAIGITPDDEAAWRWMGIAYERLGQYDKAVTAEQEAVRLKPDDAEAWYELGLSYKATGQRPEVVKVYERLKTLDSSLAEKFFREDILP